MFFYLVMFVVLLLMRVADCVIQYLFAGGNVYNKRKVLLFFYAAVFFVLVITAFRFMVGWDYIHYYNAVKNGVDNNIMLRGEAFTVLVVELARQLDSANFYFGVNAAIFFSVFVMVVKKHSPDPWMSFFLFLSVPLFYLNSLSVVRIFTAVALVFFAFKYIASREILKYLLLVLLAAMFHKTAVVALCFYFFARINISIYFWLACFLLAPFSTWVIDFLVGMLFPDYLVYLAPSGIQEGTKVIYFFLFFAILFLVFKEEIIAKEKIYLVPYNIYLFGVFIYLIFFEYGTAGHRLSLYGTIFSVILIPIFLSKIRPLCLGVAVNIVFYLACMLMFFLTLNLGALTYIPYSFIFDGF